MKKFGYVYITYNRINEKMYVGQKKSDVFVEKYKGSGIALSRAIEKYGYKNFDTIIVEWCKNQKELDLTEEKWIWFLECVESDDFYNIARGGCGGDTISGLPQDIRKRISEGKRGDNNPSRRQEVRKAISLKVSGKNNGMYGKKVSEDTINKRKRTIIERHGEFKNQYSYNKIPKEKHGMYQKGYKIEGDKNGMSKKVYVYKNHKLIETLATRTECVKIYTEKGVIKSIIEKSLAKDEYIKNLHIGNNQFKERNLKCQTQFGEYKFSYKIEDTEVNN